MTIRDTIAADGKPLAIDLFCGLGGWTEGLLSEGYRVIGFDIERHAYGDQKYPAQLVIQDVLTIHGSQFEHADLIVASPPCQEFSYMAMPWTRAKQIAKGLRGEGGFPEGYKGSRTRKQLTALFDACFRIQREASEAAGRHIPMVVENVRGACPWVGKSRWNFGSFHLWGDVPALMPVVRKSAKVPGFRFDGSGKSFQTASVAGTKTLAHVNRRDGHSHTRHLTNQREHDAVRDGLTTGPLSEGFKGVEGKSWIRDKSKDPRPSHGNSPARKAASAQIAKIPLTLSRHIAAYYYPKENE